MIRSISVFCGSSIGRQDTYRRAAVDLGMLMAAKGITLVYGGGNIGMMGAIADTVLEQGGRVTGIMPQYLLEKEIAHTGVQDMHIVKSLMERKEMMIDISDAFIVLPGGFGTLDELFEVVTMLQLSIINSPVGIVNTDGYFDELIRMMDKGVHEQFVKPVHRENILVDESVKNLFTKILEFNPAANEAKWIDNLKKENRYL